jgi:putative transposase
MTANPNPIDAPAVLEYLQQAEPDLLRSMLAAFVQALMGADADAQCGAEYGARSPDRTNQRNGYRQREWDTRAGTIELAIPKLREGSYFPDWLLERRKRAERALISVVATSYLLGVSTRRMEKLVEQLGITRLSKSQVSVMAKDLDAQVEAFRTRPLDAGPYTFIAADALTMKVREAGRVVNLACLVATGVNADGHREILGLDVCSVESHAGWLTFFRGLTARGLSGVSLVTSDAHPRTGGRRRRDPCWRELATVPHPLRGEPDASHPEVIVGVGQKHCCTRSTTSPTPTPCTPSSTGSSTLWPTNSPRLPHT